MRESTVDLPGLRLAACEWGAPDAPPLLAVHGWLDNAASFARLAPLLANDFRVIALDLPGHGRSGHLPAGRLQHYHFVDYVDAVIAVADALELERFQLLGHSLGAGIAALVAAATGERVERLALIEGLGPIADEGERTLDRFRDALRQRERTGSKRLRTFADLDTAVAARASAGGLETDAARLIVERGTHAVDGGFRWSSDARLTLGTPVRLDEAQVRALLRGIVAPTRLLLATPETPYLPATMMRERAACVADVRVMNLAGGHHLHLEHPQAVAAQLFPSREPA